MKIIVLETIVASKPAGVCRMVVKNNDESHGIPNPLKKSPATNTRKIGFSLIFAVCVPNFFNN